MSFLAFQDNTRCFLQLTRKIYIQSGAGTVSVIVAIILDYLERKAMATL